MKVLCELVTVNAECPSFCVTGSKLGRPTDAKMRESGDLPDAVQELFPDHE